MARVIKRSEISQEIIDAGGVAGRRLTEAAKKAVERPGRKPKQVKSNCEICGLGETSVSDSGVRRKKVVSVHSKDVRIMLIAESPGSVEIERNELLVGPAGQLSDRILEDGNLPRGDVFVANILKCRPLNDRDPKPKEIKACFPFLLEEIRKVKPIVIMPLGSPALKAITGLTSIERWAGKRLYSRIYNCWIIPMIHPSAILRRKHQTFDSILEWDMLDYKISVKAVKAAKKSQHAMRRILKVDKRLVASKEEAAMYCRLCKQAKAFAFDFETYFEFSEYMKKGLTNFPGDKIAKGLGLCRQPGFAVYIPEEFLDKQMLMDLFSSENIKIAHNFKFDQDVAAELGIEIKGKRFDTMLAHHLIDENLPHGLDDLEWVYLDKGGRLNVADEYYDTPYWDSISQEIMCDYCCDDCESAFLLFERFQKILKEQQLDYVFENISMPLIDVVSSMEKNGVYIDQEKTQRLSDCCTEIAELEQTVVHNAAGGEFNINSGQQLGNVLYKKLRLPAKKTPKGNWKTDADTLENLIPFDKSNIINHVLAYKKQKKILSTYCNRIKRMLKDSGDGRAHFKYVQHGTVTGRLSSGFHQFPRDKMIRAQIAAPLGRKLISTDFEQIELRIGALMSGDKELLRAFETGEDIHRFIAAQIYECSLDEVTDEMRTNAKRFDFSVFYGAGVGLIVEYFGVSLEKAQKLYDAFFNRFRRVKEWAQEQYDFVSEMKFVVDIFGRRRRLPAIDSENEGFRAEAERQSINSPVQGGASDCACIALIRLYDRIKREELDAKIIAFIHDEIILEVDDSISDYCCKLVKEECERPIPQIDVPLKVDINVVQNWWDDHESGTRWDEYKDVEKLKKFWR